MSCPFHQLKNTNSPLKTQTLKQSNTLHSNSNSSSQSGRVPLRSFHARGLRPLALHSSHRVGLFAISPRPFAGDEGDAAAIPHAVHAENQCRFSKPLISKKNLNLVTEKTC